MPVPTHSLAHPWEQGRALSTAAASVQESAEPCRDSFCENVPPSPSGLTPDSLAHPAEPGLRSRRAEAAPTAAKSQGRFLHMAAFAGHAARKELGVCG